MGIALAAKHPFVASTEYYHRADLPIVDFDPQRKAETESFVYLSGIFTVDGAKYTFVTTHFWDTGNGKPDHTQQELIGSLIERLETVPAHVLCGDFNIPREHNPLYEKLASRYDDAFPLHYPSSLDRTLHRLGNSVLDEPIFDTYMVDYVFTQSPYVASNTRLHFGVSDHAAITTEISIRP
jgi:endonuclease/exonuclease/phosphatase family metal-dependent hydrolase